MRKNQSPILATIVKLFALLEKNAYLDRIQRNVHFFDEPLYYSYAAQLSEKISILIKEGYVTDYENVIAGGLSFASKEEAFVRCLGEAAERSCLYSFHPQTISQTIINNKKTT